MDKVFVAVVAEDYGSAFVIPRAFGEESFSLRAAATPRAAKETFRNQVVCGGMSSPFGSRFSIATATVKLTAADGAVLTRSDGAAVLFLGHCSPLQEYELQDCARARYYTEKEEQSV